MSTLQEQDQDLANSYSIRSKAAIPRIGLYEYCSKNVHKKVGNLGSLSSLLYDCKIEDFEGRLVAIDFDYMALCIYWRLGEMGGMARRGPAFAYACVDTVGFDEW